MIRHHVREGEPIARVADRFGVSRQTIYNHLSKERQAPAPRRERGSKLDRHKPYLKARLRQFDIPATVLLRELQQRGFEGGITLVRDYVRQVKGARTQRLTERFETLPGQQAQLDWGSCGSIEINGKRQALYVFVLVLGYSRMLFARFTTSMKLPALLRCLREAFEVLGVPREVLVDNMKQAVEEHRHGETVRWNRGFLDFCEHYGCVPVASPPYWPRVKGKIERGVGYLKRSFLEGRSCSGLVDLNQQLTAWVDSVANVRIHGTIGQRPLDRYREEEAQLGAASGRVAYDTRALLPRQVHHDSHLSLFGTRYSVHPVAVGKTVTVRLDSEQEGAPLAVYLGDRLVARHQVASAGQRSVTLAEHARAIRVLNRTNGDRGRPRSRTPRFIQSEATADTVVPFPAPQVQSPSLTDYERWAEPEHAS